MFFLTEFEHKVKLMLYECNSNAITQVLIIFIKEYIINQKNQKIMKNHILTAALAFGLIASANSIEGDNLQNNLNNVTEVAIVDVSPFCQSISKNDIQTVKKLIKMGVSVNKFSGGKSPLMYAARYNRIEIIKLLVEKGADIKAVDKHGTSVAQYAKRSGAIEAYELLKEMRKSK